MPRPDEGPPLSKESRELLERAFTMPVEQVYCKIDKKNSQERKTVAGQAK